VKIITRDISSRLSRSKHIFLRENPHLKKLFEKLQKHGIKSLQDLKPVEGNETWGHCCPVCGSLFGEDFEKYEEHVRKCKIYQNIKNIMIECEVEWTFHLGDIPYMTFHNHAPMKGDFANAIPKIIKELLQL